MLRFTSAYDNIEYARIVSGFRVSQSVKAAAFFRKTCSASVKNDRTERKTVMKIFRCVLTCLLALMLALSPVLTPLSESGRAYALLGKVDYSKYIKTFQTVNNVLLKFGPTKDYAQVFSKVISYANTANTIVGVISSICEKLFGKGNGSTETPITMETLYDGIVDIQASLSQVNQKLDDIAEAILDMQVSIEEHERAGIARSESAYLNLFNDNHCKPLDTYIEKYQTELNLAFKKWYTQPGTRGSNADIVLLHAMLQEEDGTQTQSLLMTNADNPAAVTQTDTGIDADPTLTVRIPAEAFSALPAYSIDTCADSFRDAVYQYAVSQGADDAKAKLYAQEAYETLTYRLGCTLMEDENLWRTSFDGIKTAFSAYLTAVLSNNTGLNAQLQLMYNVYAFESEARESINLAADQMIARTTLYGMFVIDLLKKNGLTTSTELTKLMDDWTDTIDSIEEIRSRALTQHDDYCYLTGTRLISAKAQFYAQNIVIFQKSKESLSSVVHVIPSNWLSDDPESTFTMRITGPDGLFVSERLSPNTTFKGHLTDSVTTVMLYHLYQLDGEATSFADYLTRCGANKGEYIKAAEPGPIITKYSHTERMTSKESDPFTLTAKTLRGSDFKDGQSYQLSSVSNSKWNLFEFRHKVVGDFVDSGSGSKVLNTVLAAAFDYSTRETNNIGQWLPKNLTDFTTGDTKIVGSRSDYKGMFDSAYYTDFNDSYYRDLYILYLEPVETSGGGLLKASNGFDPLAYYLNSAESWMQERPAAKTPFTHTPIDQTKIRIINNMGSSVQDRMNEYAALIREEAARKGLPEPSQDEISALQKQMEQCWQEVWAMANGSKAMQEDVPVQLTDYEMKVLVDDIINRDYVDDPSGGTREIKVENLNMSLMNDEDMNLYLRIAPRAAVEYKDGAYQVISCFDITPIVAAHSYTLKNGFAQLTEDFEEPIYIDDQLLHHLRLNIRIPVTERSQGNVQVRRFDNWYTFQEDKVYTAAVQSDGQGRYLDLNEAHLSDPNAVFTGPLSVAGDYVPQPDPRPVPSTGDHSHLLLCVLFLLASAAALTVFARKRRG